MRLGFMVVMCFLNVNSNFSPQIIRLHTLLQAVQILFLNMCEIFFFGNSLKVYSREASQKLSSEWGGGIYFAILLISKPTKININHNQIAATSSYF